MNALTPQKATGAPVAQEPPQSETVQMMAAIREMALNKDLPFERIDRAMDFYERAQQWQARRAFDSAFAAMQPELPVVERKGKISGESRRTGEVISQGYGRWEDISPAIMPVMAKHGFAIRFRQEPVTDAAGTTRTRITCILSHRDGHREEAFFDLPLDTTGSKNNVQAYGSTASYGRRYSAMLALNIVTRGEDDDGHKSGGAISDEQADEIASLIQETKSNIDRFLRWIGAPSIPDIPAGKYTMAIQMLNAKKRGARP